MGKNIHAVKRVGRWAVKKEVADASSHHVVSNPRGGWSVKREGSNKASRTFENQQEAVDYAKNALAGQGGDVVIHGRDGRIRDKETIHGRDPHPPKARRR